MRASLEEIAKSQDKTIQQVVEAALDSEGSIRSAAKRIGISYTSLYLWLARNGYAVKTAAHLVPVQHHITQPEPVNE